MAAFSSADIVHLSEVTTRQADEGQELLNVQDLGQKIQESGVKTIVHPVGAEIATAVQNDLQAKDILVVMSNGSFGGLLEKLKQILK